MELERIMLTSIQQCESLVRLLWEAFCFNALVPEALEGLADKEPFDVGDNGVGNDKGCTSKGAMLAHVLRRSRPNGVLASVGQPFGLLAEANLLTDETPDYPRVPLLLAHSNQG